MTPVLPSLDGHEGWGTWGGRTLPCFSPDYHLYLMPPGRACDGASPLLLSLGVTEGETLTSGSPKAASVSSAAIPPSPAEFFPPLTLAAGCLAKEADGKREQQTPKMCHCAKCFQTLQDVTVSQFQFIRRRREDAVTSKRSFSL